MRKGSGESQLRSVLGWITPWAVEALRRTTEKTLEYLGLLRRGQAAGVFSLRVPFLMGRGRLLLSWSI